MDITDYGAIGQIAVAFAAGLVSFLSPCVLPLVPGYISIVSGSSLDQLKAREKDASLLRTVLLNSVMFIVGFSLTFILLGASATWIGQVLVSRMQLLGRIAGLILIVFGIHLLGIPCIGPILAGILTIASTKQTVTDGMFLLAVYSAGLGIPFLLTSLALNKFLSFYGRFKKHFHAVEVASGALVIAVGLLMVTGSLSRLAAWFSFLNRFAL